MALWKPSSPGLILPSRRKFIGGAGACAAMAALPARPAFAASSYALVNHVAAQARNTVTTAAKDFTGVDLVIAAFQGYPYGGSPSQIKDTFGQTLTPLALLSLSDTSLVQLWYLRGGTVGSSQQWHLDSSGGDTYATLEVMGFSGSASSSLLNISNSNTASGVSTIQPGSITPSVSGCLVVCTANNGSTSNAASISSPYNTPDPSLIGASGAYTAGLLSYFIQTAAAATNPTITQSGTNTPGPMGAFIAAFAPASYSPPTPGRAQVIVNIMN
jgi:hypothetical protein